MHAPYFVPLHVAFFQRLFLPFFLHDTADGDVVAHMYILRAMNVYRCAAGFFTAAGFCDVCAARGCFCWRGEEVGMLGVCNKECWCKRERTILVFLRNELHSGDGQTFSFYIIVK